ncbi:MAG: hypothetical protein JO042_16820 [Sinobacteraceae bacterium]|nr:hypothetical protein [Nevskiaceae bacterium]
MTRECRHSEDRSVLATIIPDLDRGKLLKPSGVSGLDLRQHMSAVKVQHGFLGRLAAVNVYYGHAAGEDFVNRSNVDVGIRAHRPVGVDVCHF